MWNDISFWLWFALPWWLVMLSMLIQWDSDPSTATLERWDVDTQFWEETYGTYHYLEFSMAPHLKDKWIWDYWEKVLLAWTLASSGSYLHSTVSRVQGSFKALDLATWDSQSEVDYGGTVADSVVCKHKWGSFGSYRNIHGDLCRKARSSA